MPTRKAAIDIYTKIKIQFSQPEIILSYKNEVSKNF